MGVDRCKRSGDEILNKVGHFLAQQCHEEEEEEEESIVNNNNTKTKIDQNRNHAPLIRKKKVVFPKLKLHALLCEIAVSINIKPLTKLD